MDVELRQLRYFLTVADELNFTRAAARLHLDQPSLSRQIRKLEAAIGAPLFIRTSRRVALTADGERLRERVAALVVDLDHVLAEAKQQARAQPTRLRLGWLIPLRDQLMARLVRAFELETGIGTQLVRYDFTDPSAGLSTRAVDAAIVNPPLSARGLSYQALLHEPRVLIMANTHPLARQNSVTLAELDHLDVHWAVPPSNDQVWQDYWAVADLPGRGPPPRRTEYRDVQEYLQAVAVGHVLGMTIVGAVGDALADCGIAAVPVADLTPATMAVAWHSNDTNPLLPILAAAARTLVKAKASPRSAG